MKDFTHPKFPTIHIKLLTTETDLEKLNQLTNPLNIDSETISGFIPENCSKDNKYLYGIFDADTLIGVIDLIEEYPEKENAYIHHFLLAEDYLENNLSETLYISLEKTAQETGVSVMHVNPELLSDFWNNQGFTDNTKSI